MVPNQSSSSASAKPKSTQDKRNGERRAHYRTPKTISNIEKLGIAVRVGWSWLIIPVLTFIGCRLLGLPDMLSLIGAIDPLLRTIRDWRK